MVDYDVISTLPLFNQSNYFYSLNSTMIGKCKWTSLNSAITSVLLLSFALNALAAIVVFRVPLVSNRGRSNPLHLCIRFLNAVDMIQVRAIEFLVFGLKGDADNDHCFSRWFY